MHRRLANCMYVCSVIVPAGPATAQSAVGPDAALPYGGPKITPGSLPWGPSGPALPPSDPSGPCETNPPALDPCVLTARYDAHRTGTNQLESNLAGMTATSSFNNFGIAYVYPVTTIQQNYVSEPVVAQPLYITNVNVPNAPSSMCGGTKYCNMLIVASLSGVVYAFDTGTPPTATGGNTLWTRNLAQADCGSGAGPYLNSNNFLPGATNLPYYGVVATPVIDTAPAHPTAFVVSACVPSGGTTAIQWYIDSIDLTNGSIRNTTATQIQDANFYSSNQLARSALLLTHPGGGTTYVYTAFGAGVREIAAYLDSTFLATKRYSGVVFAYPYTYPSTFGSSLTPLYTTCMGTASNCTSTTYGSGYNEATILFPSVFTQLAKGYSSGGPAGYPDCNGIPGYYPTLGCGVGVSNCGPSNCSPGSSWAVNTGGIWMSGDGMASTSAADVIFGVGNGAFACGTTGSTQTGCTNPSSVAYWGESTVELPPACTSSPCSAGVASGTLSSTSGFTAQGPNGTQCLLTFNGNTSGSALVTLPVSNLEPLIIMTPGSNYTSAPTSATASVPSLNGATTCNGSSVAVNTTLSTMLPVDFFAANTPRFICSSGCNLGTTNDPSPASYEVQELSRLDQDNAVGGILVIPQTGGTNFIATANKAGFLTVTPPPTGEISTNNTGMGGFQQNDSGLTGGTGYSTEVPFQASRLPTSSHQIVCPSISSAGLVSKPTGQSVSSCDEIHNLAFYNNSLVVFPSNESVEVFKGSYSSGPPKNYTFGSSAAYDPCPYPFNSVNCTGSYPSFPRTDPASAGGAMSIASKNPQSLATLWTILPYANNWGSLYGYTLDTSDGSLAYLWDTYNPASFSNGGPHKCTWSLGGSTPASGWIATAFTPPTLADNQQTVSSVTTNYGAVYIPTVCVVNDPNGTIYSSCANVPSADIKSGVIVATNCPDN